MFERGKRYASIVINELHVLFAKKGIDKDWLKSHYDPSSAETQKELELRIVRLQGVLDGLVLADKLSKKEIAPLYDELSTAWHTARQ